MSVGEPVGATKAASRGCSNDCQRFLLLWMIATSEGNHHVSLPWDFYHHFTVSCFFPFYHDFTMILHTFPQSISPMVPAGRRGGSHRHRSLGGRWHWHVMAWKNGTFLQYYMYILNMVKYDTYIYIYILYIDLYLWLSMVIQMIFVPKGYWLFMLINGNGSWFVKVTLSQDLGALVTPETAAKCPGSSHRFWHIPICQQHWSWYILILMYSYSSGKHEKMEKTLLSGICIGHVSKI